MATPMLGQEVLDVFGKHEHEAALSVAFQARVVDVSCSVLGAEPGAVYGSFSLCA